MQEIIGNLIYDFGDLVGLGDMIFPILMGAFLFFLLFLGFPVAVALATSGFLFAFLAGQQQARDHGRGKQRAEPGAQDVRQQDQHQAGRDDLPQSPRRTDGAASQ